MIESQKIPTQKAAFLTLLAMALFLGCAPASTPAGNVVSVIQPVTPTGTLYGQLYDAFTHEPLAGADITLLNGDKKTTTDDDGRFTFSAVPASAGLAVEMRLEGYSSSLVEVTLENEAGNLAQDNAVAFVGPIYLLPLLDDGLELTVVKTNGTPVAGARVNASLDVAFLDGDLERGLLVASVTEPSDGLYRLRSMPDLSLLAAFGIEGSLRISMRTSDGKLLYQVIDVATADYGNTLRIELDDDLGAPDEQDSLMIIDSNVADLLPGGLPLLPTVLDINQNITLTFSEPILPEVLFFVAQDAQGRSLPTQVDVSNNPTIVLTLSDDAGWAKGQEVQLWVDAISQASIDGVQSQVSMGGSFFVVEQGTAQLRGGALKAANGNFICPASTGFLEIPLSTALGGRQASSNGATPLIDAGNGVTFLPITVTSSTVPETHPLARGVLATLIEPNSVAAKSGFAPILRIPWATTDHFGDIATSIELNLRVVFNDAASAAERGTAGTAIVRSPIGQPVGTVSTVIPVSVGIGAMTGACQ